MGEYDFDTIRKVCHCGHDKVTHHEGVYNCLGLYCDCLEYVNEWTDAPMKKAPVRIGRVEEDDEPPDTDPMIWGIPVSKIKP